jgi:hypothetical protein
MLNINYTTVYQSSFLKYNNRKNDYKIALKTGKINHNKINYVHSRRAIGDHIRMRRRYL